MISQRFIVVILASVISVVPQPGATDTVGTNFVYQGVLADAGAPISGTFDFRVFLYNADVGGGQVGGTVLVEGVPVTDGRVTVDLDFGNVFDGTALWLEIHVRETGTIPYTSLLPRQPLTATPFATLAAEAGDAAQLAGQTPGYYLAWSNLTGLPDGLDDGDDDTLADLSCSAGEIAKWNGSIWVCDDDLGNHSSTYSVGPVGSTTENGTALLAAAAALPTATESAQILLKVEPGTYDLGGASLFLADWVSLEGAGRNLTTIVSAAGTYDGTIALGMRSGVRSVTALNSGAVPGQNSVAISSSYLASVSDVTAISDGNADNNNIALRNSGGSVTIEQVHLEVKNGAGGTRIALENSSNSLTIREVEAIVSGGGETLYAIKSNGTGTFIGDGVTAFATGGSHGAYGIQTAATDVTLKNSVIDAQTTTISAYGFYSATSSGGTFKMFNVEATASGDSGWINVGVFLSGTLTSSVLDHVRAVSNAYGVHTSASHGDLTILDSHLSGPTAGLSISVSSTIPVKVHRSDLISSGNGLENFGTGIISVASSQITNGASGGVVCSGVWDENYTFYASTCP